MAPGCKYLLVFLLVLGSTASALQTETVIHVSDSTADVTRIIGGTSTTIEDFPWQVALSTLKSDEKSTMGIYRCGGSIISKTWIMSAAHCLSEQIPGNNGFIVTAKWIAVAAGVTNKSMITESDVQYINETEFEDRLFIHPKYNKGAWSDNDIALIQLVKPLTFNNKIKPIPLANPFDFIPGKEVITSGWGKTTDDGQGTKILQYVDGLELLSRKKCKEYWNEIVRKKCREDCNGDLREVCKEHCKEYWIELDQKKCREDCNEKTREECRGHCSESRFDFTNKMICHKTEKRNVCSGDSGGPVITGLGNSNESPYVQIGINSFVPYNGCEMYTTAVFTDVAKFTNWINRTISRKCKSGNKRCSRLASKGMCSRKNVSKKCMKTCTECGFPN